jgi:peroxiredoxin
MVLNKNKKFCCIFLVILATSAFCFKPGKNIKTYHIIGQIKGIRNDSVYLYNTLTNQKESTLAKDGKFSFSGHVDYPEMYQIYFDAEANKWFGIFLENSNISVHGHIDSLINIRIEGSESNNEYRDYRLYSKQVHHEYFILDSLMTEAQDVMEYDKADSLEEVTNKAAHRILENVYDYASTHKNSVVIPYITNMACFNTTDKILSDKILDFLDIDSRKNPRITALNKMIDDMNKTSVGQPAPDFELVSNKGNKVKLSSFRGKVVLLDFWTSWCNPCIKSFTGLKQVYEKYNGDQFEMIGFSVDKDKQAWEKSINTNNLPWMQLVDLKGADGITPKDYGIMFIPALFLIDKKGNIAGTNLHGKKLMKAIEEGITQKE